MQAEQGADITRNARTIEWLKAEMVASTGQALRLLAAGNQDQALDSLADVVIATYLLARRMGVPFSRLDLKVDAKLGVNIEQRHQVEQWYGDLSKLRAHLQSR